MKKDYVVQFTPTFSKKYTNLPSNIKEKARKKEPIFRQDPFSPSLKTHKLTGKLSAYWSFSIDYQYRIIFRFIENDTILFVDVGTHSIYK